MLVIIRSNILDDKPVTYVDIYCTTQEGLPYYQHLQYQLEIAVTKVQDYAKKAVVWSLSNVISNSLNTNGKSRVGVKKFFVFRLFNPTRVSQLFKS